MSVTSFEEIRALAEEIKGGFSTRDSMYKGVEDMFLLSDSLPGNNQTSVEDFLTIDPSPRNALIGMARLLTSTTPKWKVPYEVNSMDAQEKSSRLEKFADAVWTGNNRIKGKPQEYKAVLAGLLYDEVHISVATTKDMAAMATGANKRRMEDIAERAPLVFEVISPKICFPVFDNFGLVRHVSSRKMKVVDVISRWGKKAESVLGERKQTDEVTYNEYWDTESHCVWVTEAEGEIELDTHDLPYIPIACAIIEGNELFEDRNETRQPALYTYYKSGLWRRLNLALSVMNWMTFNIGLSPMFVYKRSQDHELTMDYSTPGGYIGISREEDLHQLQKQVIDPSIMEAMKIAEQKGMESTIYRQALGEPLGGNAPYSMVALLSQAGRLPLVPYQRVVSHVIGTAMNIGISMLRDEGGAKIKTTGTKNGQEVVDLKKEDIPERVEIECSLEIDMPQDERQNIQIATQGTQGDHPLFSVRYARESILQIENSDDMDEEIWGERIAWLKAQEEYVIQQQQVQQQMQQMQQQKMAAAQGGMPGQPGMPQGQPGQPPTDPTMQQPPDQGMPQAGGMPQGIPPEVLAQMQRGGQQAQPGLPMTQPMDPNAQGMPPEMVGGMNAA